MRWHHWTIFGLGLWLIVNPWLLGFYKINLAVWSSLASGVLIIVLVLWNMAPPED